jgi:large subunit ribosomal protein L18
MAQGPTFRVKFRRRREGKTNYYRRRRLLLSRLPRLVVRKTNTNTIVQLVNASVVGDTTVASAISTELGNHGWKAGTGNIPAAYLTGFLAGLRAKSRGVKEAILDVGLNPPVKGSRVYAALKGAIEVQLMQDLMYPMIKKFFLMSQESLGSTLWLHTTTLATNQTCSVC